MFAKKSATAVQGMNGKNVGPATAAMLLSSTPPIKRRPTQAELAERTSYVSNCTRSLMAAFGNTDAISTRQLDPEVTRRENIR